MTTDADATLCYVDVLDRTTSWAKRFKCQLGKQLALREMIAANIRRSADEEECYDYYLRCRGRADNAAIAWMGCFRRRALPHLSRDTATLVAKMLADPMRWLE